MFLLRGYFQSIPAEIEEAAFLEGGSTLMSLRLTVLPMVVPGFLTAILLQAMGTWNGLYRAFVFLYNPNLMTISVGLRNLFQRDIIDWPRPLAALAALTRPALVVYTFFQRRLVEGFSSGSLK